MTNEELAIQAQQGDQKAMLQLWKQIERLVRMKARRRLPDDGHTSRVELDDLMQAGYLAMARAVKDFAPDGGFAFTTYLTYHLKTAFATELGIRTTRRDALLNAVSIDQPAGAEDDGSSQTVENILEAKEDRHIINDMLERLDTERAFSVVMKCVDKLESMQATVIKAHYLYCHSFREIAAMERIALAEAKQSHDKGMRRLRLMKEVRAVGRELYIDAHTNFFLQVGLTAFQNGASSAVERLAERRERLMSKHERGRP
ncbi:RNA polymerase sigma factor [Ethanoligenens sp.]|uniref:RNA polymerase sigma factor n=1 Tax=Ethanoligenens sp. TaxID=2099655 RepID=UPI0039E9730D